jgi:hypothetical protein
MPRSHDVQSGPDDQSEAVDNSDAELASVSGDNNNDSDYNDIDTRRRQHGQQASSSSQQVNRVRQSTVNAQAASVAAVLNNIPSSDDVSAEGRDLQLATLLLRNRRTAQELKKRELALAEREQLLEGAVSKRARVSNSSSNGASADDYGLDDDILNLLGMNNDGGVESLRSRDVSASNGNRGKDLTLRQLAISEFSELGYVDIRVFARNNLTVRSTSKLQEFKSTDTSPEQFIAAWSSYNLELQKYLLRHNRVDDALMVTKYYNQLIRLLTDYPTQWGKVKELDAHIRSTEHMDAPIVWTVDADDDEVSQFKADIRYGHQGELRAVPSSQSGTSSSTQRRGGNSNSSVSKPRRSVAICYAYNGEVRPNEWTNVNHCRGANQCKFRHKCMICGFDHAVYESASCASQPRARAPIIRHK